MLIAQITDCHIVEPGATMADRIDPTVGLRAAIDVVNAMAPLPDLVLATGDLVNDGTAAQYDVLDELFATIRPPLHVIPGNHDDRTELRRRYPDLPPGGPDDPIDYVIDPSIDGAGLLLVALDTSIPGRQDGELRPAQLEWLDATLAAAPDRPTIVFQHHPPFASGIVWMDRTCGFAGADAEANVIARHPQVQAVLCGHYHRAIHRRFGGTVASSTPSTAVQLALDLVDGPPRYSAEPAAIALHDVAPDGTVTSHVLPTGDVARWTPAWARDDSTS